MTYSDFTLDLLEEQFELSNKLIDIFPINIKLFQTSNWFKETLKKSKDLPLLTLVEAKNHDINIGIAQCSAQMLGRQVFNKKHKVELLVIYSCITTGNELNFLKLE